MYRFHLNVLLLSSVRWGRSSVRFTHYLSQANPVRQPKDLVSCILNSTVHHDDQTIVFNKPPGVMVLGKHSSLEVHRSLMDITVETWNRKAEASSENEDGESTSFTASNPCTIQYHMPQFRAALQWDHFFPCIRTPKSVLSHLCFFTVTMGFHLVNRAVFCSILVMLNFTTTSNEQRCVPFGSPKNPI